MGIRLQNEYRLTFSGREDGRHGVACLAENILAKNGEQVNERIVSKKMGTKELAWCRYTHRRGRGKEAYY